MQKLGVMLKFLSNKASLIEKNVTSLKSGRPTPPDPCCERPYNHVKEKLSFRERRNKKFGKMCLI
jgi:hypothetical protein